MPETEHKGLPVRKHSAAVRGASGDALNGAMKVSPQDLDPGQSAYIVLEVQPNGDQFKPMDDGEAWEHVDILKVLRGAFLPGKEALPFLDNVTVKLEEIRVEETGQERLAMDTKLEDDHRAGLHKRKRKGCKLCEAVAEEGARELANSAPKRPGGRRGRGAPKGGKVVDAADRFQVARGNPAQVALRLSELADELDDVNVRRERLMDERVALWKKGKTLGMNATDLGKVSRVQAVTVRQRLMKESANA